VKATAQIALDWARRSFGAEHVSDVPVRCLRLAEEAVELAQAAGVPKDKLLDLVGIVYSRPKGEIAQEIGGVMMTATVLCAALDTDTDWHFENELRRVLAKSTEHFAKRNQEKIDLGLNASPDDSLTDPSDMEEPR
jgi:NTP pyrophosphatase (non-canonical NTP hydrolase)